MRMTSLPAASSRNSPAASSSLRAFHCAGLWLAVMMMPPSARCEVTASSVVGVVARPRSTTSKPMAASVPHTRCRIMSPVTRASRPTTMRPQCPPLRRLMNVAYAAANFTISFAPRPSPAGPPIVPRMPEIDFMSAIYLQFQFSRASVFSTEIFYIVYIGQTLALVCLKSVIRTHNEVDLRIVAQVLERHLYARAVCH